MGVSDMDITSVDQLETLYQPGPAAAATVKEVNWITPGYARLISASPFVTIATVGPEGVDCSPRGGSPGFVRILDDRTLALPDRRGNNRIDALRNIIRDPRCALLFLIPGSGTTLRVNGSARISSDKDLLASFAVDDKLPRTVLLIRVEEAYFQCARAVVRSKLWDPELYADPGSLPTPGQLLADMSQGTIGGQVYDREWPARAAATLW